MSGSFSTSNTLGPVLNDYTTVSTTSPDVPAPPFAVGTRVFGSNGTEWVYTQASANITANFVCQIAVDGTAEHITTANSLLGLLVGVPLVTIPSGSYGWLQVRGPCSIRVGASCAANVRLNTTTTAGQLDDDATTGAKEVLGLALTSARGGTAGPAAAMLNYPNVRATI